MPIAATIIIAIIILIILMACIAQLMISINKLGELKAEWKGGEYYMGLPIVHIKDINKFPLTPRFHVRILDLSKKTEHTILDTKDLDLATEIAKRTRAANGPPDALKKIVVTKEKIIQMY